MVGPDLTQIGSRQTADELRHSILDPDAILAENCPGSGGSEIPCQPGIMPKDYGQRLNGAQLETLVAYLGGMK
jgi:hypothetical protein